MFAVDRPPRKQLVKYAPSNLWWHSHKVCGGEILSICHNPKGRLIVCTQKGVEIYNSDYERVHSFQSEITLRTLAFSDGTCYAICSKSYTFDGFFFEIQELCRLDVNLTNPTVLHQVGQVQKITASAKYIALMSQPSNAVYIYEITIGTSFEIHRDDMTFGLREIGRASCRERV